jgi:hypothetical protein
VQEAVETDTELVQVRRRRSMAAAEALVERVMAWEFRAATATKA